MRLVGLTGDIAAGKSTVAAMLADRGAAVVDADGIARQVVEPGTPALAAVVGRFGSGVLLPDGRLDRPALAAIVFDDEQARRDLEAITHPAIGAEMARQAAALAKEAESAAVVMDIPLLVDKARYGLDMMIVVTAPVEERARRLVELRGTTEAEARARIAAQAHLEGRADRADVVIDNSGSLAELASQVDSLWARLRP